MISIIIPVFNCEKYIENCLYSILNQTYRDIEVICINDGSTDCSLEKLKAIALRDARVKILNVSNGGTSKARNTGLIHAQGQLVLFVDSDDELKTPFSIEVLVSNLTDDVDGVISSATVMHEYNYTGKSLEDDQKYFSIANEGKFNLDAKLLTSTSVTVWGKLFRKSVIDELELRFPENLRFEDEFWFRAYFANRKAAFIKESTYNYNRRVGSIMHQADSHGIELLYILEALICFYEKIGIREKMEDVLRTLAYRYFYKSQKYSPPWNHPYCLTLLTDILRRYDIDCGNSQVLNEIKNGSYLVNLASKGQTKIKNIVAKQLPELIENDVLNLEQLALVLRRYRRLLRPLFRLFPSKHSPNKRIR